VLFARIGGPVSAYVEYIVLIAGYRPPHRLKVEPHERLVMRGVRVILRIPPSDNPQIYTRINPKLVTYTSLSSKLEHFHRYKDVR
jgi:hypothetical protein